MLLGGWQDGSSRALSRSRLEMGDHLVAAGACAWLAHSVLTVGLVATFAVSFTNVLQAGFVAGGIGLSFLGATIAGLVGSFLLGAGLLVYARGVDALVWSDPGTGRLFRASPGTRAKAGAAGILAIVYGVQGVIAVLSFVFLPSTAVSLDFAGSRTLVQLLLLNWIVAAVLLIASALLTGSFLSSLRRDVASQESLGAVGFTAYAIMNAIAVFFLAASLLFLVSSPTFGRFVLPALVAMGALMEFVVVPIIGVRVFALMIPAGLRLRRIQPGDFQVGYPRYVTHPPYPIPTDGPLARVNPMGPYIRSSSAAVFASGPEPIETEPPPPPPDDFPSVPEGGESWVLQMESEIRELESALDEQRRLLVVAEQGWKEGRVDSSTYENATQSGRARILEVERRISERRSRLDAGRDGVVNPP